MTRNHNATTKLTSRAESIKCANCGAADTIFETDMIGYPFACGECDHWGETELTTDNPPPTDEELYRMDGQVRRRPIA